MKSLNDGDTTFFRQILGPVFEGAPWVAERTAGLRPFDTVAQLHQAMFDFVAALTGRARLEFFCQHPDLVGSPAQRADMAASSGSEQAGLALDRLERAGLDRLAEWNKAYRERFGFPFLICARRHTRKSILRQFERRLAASLADEQAAALAEVYLISRLRLVELVDGPGKPVTSGWLSTHVLDTATGRAADGVAVELVALEEEGPVTLGTRRTDTNGRVADLIDDGGPLRIGEYELHFMVGAYFERLGGNLPDPPFLDVVPLRIGVAEAEMHYHIPLLVSPWSYSTYRGS